MHIPLKDYKMMRIHIIFMRVISPTTGKLVPDLTRRMERTANL